MKPGALTWMFAALGLLLAGPAHAADTVYYYSSDTLHSEVVVTDQNRNVVERTHYAPYGQVLDRDLRDGPGYGGHEEDPETSLVYMQQRYYEPEAGRFLSTDPVQADGGGGSFNRYEYANDNPYRYTDPDGRCPECIGAAVGGGLELLIQAFNPQDRAAYESAGAALAHGDFRGAWRDAGTQLTEVGISAAAGAVGAGIAGKIGEVAAGLSQSTAATVTGKVTVGALTQIGGNAAAGAGIGAAAKAADNAITGQPLSQGVGAAAGLGAVGGAAGSAVQTAATPGIQRAANATGAYIGSAEGAMAAPGVETPMAQRLGATTTEAINHIPKQSSSCTKVSTGSGGC